MSKRLPPRSSVALLLGIWCTVPVQAQSAAYWPQFRGPDRSNVASDKGLLKEWPKEGPPLVWKVTELGEGYAPVSIADGRIYTLAYRGIDEYVVALDRGTGKEIWVRRIGPVKEMHFMQFVRQRQPVIDNDRLYAFSGEGELFCLDTDAGEIIWKKSYEKDLDGRHNGWRWNDDPLIDGDRLVCAPGAKGSPIMALNKRSGDVIWKAIIPVNERPANAPVVVAEIGDVRQYIQLLEKTLIGVAAKDGKLLWSAARDFSAISNVASPIVHENYIFLVAGRGSTLMKVVQDGGVFKVDEVYHTRAVANVFGGMLRVGDHIYGGHSDTRLTCLEMKTGQVTWQQQEKGTACVLAAEGCLYCRHHNGTVTLVEATPEAYRERGRLEPLHRSKQAAWTYPVLAGGKLYLRDQSVLLCYDVRADRPKPPFAPEKQRE